MNSASIRQQVLRLFLLGVLAFVCLAGCKPSMLPLGDDTGDEIPEVLGILVTPERVIIPLGERIQLKATGLQDDRSSTDVTNLVTWGSEDSSVAKVSDGLDEEGMIAGLREGETEVWARLDDIKSVPVQVTVTSAELLGMIVVPNEVTVQAGQTVQLKAEAAFSDGSRADASAQVLWVTGNGSVATLGAGGVLNAAGVGDTQIHADWDGVLSDPVPVHVLQVAEPELRILAVQGEAGPDDITITVTVTNDGNAGASDFWIDVFLDPSSPPSPGDMGQFYDPVWYLGPGETQDLGFNFPASVGNHEVWVIVDTDNAVAETNENNNVFSTTVDVVGVQGGANLAITYFDYYADETHILYAVDVYNAGTEDVGEFWLDLWIDEVSDPSASGVGDEYTRVSGLAAGDTENADFLVETHCSNCWSWVMVDSFEEIDETDETDNVSGPHTVDSP